MIRLLPLVLLAACATEGDDVAERAEDTAADTTTPVTTAPSGPKLNAATGACAQGEILTVDLGTTTPFGYAVEVQYADGTWEPMQASIHVRSSEAIIDGHLADYESPIYRKGSMLTFTCGYAWDDTQAGPRIDGVLVGLATGYRVTWMSEG